MQPGLSNDQGICWADSEGPFCLDGSSADGSLEGCTFAINKRNNSEPYRFHSGGANCLVADGHVQFVRDSVSLQTFATSLAGRGTSYSSATVLPRVRAGLAPSPVASAVVARHG